MKEAADQEVQILVLFKKFFLSVTNNNLILRKRIPRYKLTISYNKSKTWCQETIDDTQRKLNKISIEKLNEHNK